MSDYPDSLLSLHSRTLDHVTTNSQKSPDLPIVNVLSILQNMDIKIPSPIREKQIAAFCMQHKILKLSLFGSVLRDDFGPESDIDVLVEFLPDAKVGLFELYDLEMELSSIFGGRKVEINTLRSLSKYFRERVMDEARVQYVQA